jgi:addiction module HigA family antidote
MVKFAKELITSLTQAAKHARGGKVKGMRVKAVELPEVKAVRRSLRMSKTRDPDRCPSHPGAVLDDIMPSLGKPKAEIARLLGISRQHLHGILEENKPVSPNVAARIGKMIGNGPAIWLRLQAAHDAWHAEREVDVSRIPTLEQA